MPTVTINFLRQRRKQLTALQETDKKYAMVLGYVTGGVVIAMIVIFVVNFFFRQQLERLKAKQAAEQNKISSLASVEVEYITLAQKASDITELLKDQGVRQKGLEFFTTLFANNNVTVTEVAFLEDGIIQFQISTKDVFQFNALLNQLQSDQVLAEYPNIAVTDLNRGKSGTYNAAVSVHLAVATPTPAAATKKKVILDDNGKPVE